MNDDMKEFMVDSAIQKIYNDIDLLEGKQLHEIDAFARGLPSCAKLAQRMRKNLDIVEKAYRKAVKDNAIVEEKDDTE